MKEKLKVGIAGFGVVGKRRRIYIDQHPQLKTVAVCDRTFGSTGSFEDGLHFYSSYKELLSNEKIDVLFVCLTNEVAPEATIAGLKAGCHVFCEKPPGRDLNDIIQVIKCERNYPNLKLKYGFNHRYHHNVCDALKVIQSKELGDIINLRGVYGKSQIISFTSDWRSKRAIAGGGILLDQGIHMVDLLRVFAGEFTDIRSFISNSHWRHDVEDNAYALMRTSSGVVAMLHSSATQWRHRFHLEISLQKGSILLSGILTGSKSYGDEAITISYASSNDGGFPKEQTTRYNEDNSWRDEIYDFADSIVNDKPISSGTSSDALKTMELVYKIYCADPAWKAAYDLTDAIPKEFLK